MILGTVDSCETLNQFLVLLYLFSNLLFERQELGIVIDGI